MGKFVHGIEVAKVKGTLSVRQSATREYVDVIVDGSNKPFLKTIDHQDFVAIAHNRDIRWIRKDILKWKN